MTNEEAATAAAEEEGTEKAQPKPKQSKMPLNF